MNFDLNKLVRPNILKMKAYSSARDEFGGSEGIFLDANENPYGENNRYPDPYQKELKEKISRLKNVSVEEIFIGNGSDEIIDHVYRVFCIPGKDKIMFFPPTFGMYQVAAEINDIESIEIYLNSDFQININEAQKYFDDENLKVIVICTPNNPTGNLINPKDIEFILDNFSGIVVIDEAYIDFSSQESYLNKLNQYPNLIILQTLSKAWGIAGIRIGMAYAKNEIIRLFNKMKHPYNISTINQKTALETLNKIEKFEQNKKEILAEKEVVRRELERIPVVRKIYESDANFFLVEFKDGEKYFEELIKQKIIIRNQCSKIKNCLRITIGTKEENQKLLNALKKLK